jgi:two-component system, OmpR family, sensor histidine kinase KdpD
MSHRLAKGWRFALGLSGIAGVTLICSLISGINATTVGFAYLLLVLAIATVWGLAEAVAASVAAMLCYNYFFLPPIGQFSIADPENWIALFAFLVTALVASHLSDRAKQQALEAQRRQKETEQLYALSRAILLTDASKPIGSQVAQQISNIFGATGVVLFDAQTGTAFQGGPEELDDSTVKESSWPIHLGGHPIGALAVRGLETSDAAVQALLNLVAIAIERVRTEHATNRAEAARQSEEFKSTLLDAVAHEFKTPLTSIKAASTALLADAATFTPETNEMLSVIDEEADRLTSLVTEAVRMSQIDAGKVRLERVTIPAQVLLDAATSTFESRAEGRIQTTAPSAEQVYVDRDMMLLALRQLIDNALKYAPPSTPIRVWADRRANQVVLHVADQGPGIPESERERVFEKFYRQDKARGKVPGSGLGLHIAREIARMHGGDLRVEPTAANEFCLSLPRSAEVK